MRMSLLSLAVALLGLVVGPVQGQSKLPLAERVNKSIKQGVKYLLSRQGANGSWEGAEGYQNNEGGASALATLALLNAGVSDADRPKVERALRYLRDLEVDSVYVRALQTMALSEASLDPRRDERSRKIDLERIQRNVQWLIDARVIKQGSRLEGWGYKLSTPGTKNASTSQYAMLGLWAGKQAGIAINRELWESVREYYLRTQDADAGFWIYDPEFGPGSRDRPSLTMSTAGLAGLVIAGMELNSGREELRQDGANNCGVYLENRATTRAVQWLGKNFTLTPTNGEIFYHLYGVERAGRLSGLRFFGEHDWYREGSEFLVTKQELDGRWVKGGAFNTSITSTSFALLFLAKGRTPVLLSKTVHGAWPRKQPGQPGFDLDWNNDRNDLRNLTQFVSKQLFKNLPLAWQTYDLMWAASARSGAVSLNEDEQAEVVAEMLQSPIFYINGHDSPKQRFTGAERQLLKRYVESGGFIFAEACCTSAAFDHGFKGLVEEIWGVEAELTYLDSTHPVWSSFFPVTPGEPYKLMGLNLGCKTVLIYSPQDMSCFWESGQPDKDARADRAFKLGANVVAYATGMQPPRVRLTEMAVASSKVPADIGRKRNFFQAGQLWFKGEWQPAPKAMTRVMESLHRDANVDVVFKPEKIKLDYDELVDCKFLYLHGRLKPGQDLFTPTAEELKNLRFNLDNGGLLFADACCGDATFDKAFRAFMKTLFPDRPLEQVPLNDLLFSAGLNDVNGKGSALTEANIKCRRDPKAPPQPMAPWLEGIKGQDGRWLVLYSKYDIGCALEGHQALGCLGYDPASALKLARAAALYSLRP